jgi:hypothetical protein
MPTRSRTPTPTCQTFRAKLIVHVSNERHNSLRTTIVTHTNIARVKALGANGAYSSADRSLTTHIQGTLAWTKLRPREPQTR